MLNDATGFKKIYLAAGFFSVFFYPQLFFFLHNYRVNTFKAEDNYYLIPQSLANSSSLSSHSAVSDISHYCFPLPLSAFLSMEKRICGLFE